MKKTLLFLVAFFFFASAQRVVAQYVTIPDANFRAALQQIIPNAFNAQGEMDTTHTDVEYLNYLAVSNSNISDLDGVQYFDLLFSLDCSNNQLTSLPALSAHLLDLNCSFNQLLSLNLSANNSLATLLCNNNQLMSLDLVNNSYLHNIDCSNNDLTSLLLDTDTLTLYRRFSLDCSENNLTSLHASAEIIDCSNNNLVSLSVDYADQLYCNNNNLSTLRLTNILELSFAGNPLTSLYLNMSSGSSHRNLVGFGSSVDSLFVFCPGIISGGLNFSSIGIRYLHIDAVSIDFLDLPFNPLRHLDVTGGGITRLDCNDAQLSFLSLNCPDLQVLNCYNNVLADSFYLNCPNLQNLDCSSNRLTNLPALPSSLQSLVCARNHLTSLPALPSSLILLDVMGNYLTSLPALPSGLIDLNCDRNQLTSLPTLPSSLSRLLVSENYLTSLPALPSSLTYLDCTNNQLTCLPNLPNTLTNLSFLGNPIRCLPNYPTAIIQIDPFASLCSKPCSCPEYQGNLIELNSWTQSPTAQWRYKANGKADGGVFWNNRPAISTRSIADDAIVLDLDSIYQVNGNQSVTASLISPFIFWGTFTGNVVYLSFYQYFRNHSGTASVGYSFDNGTTWTYQNINTQITNGEESATYQKIIIPIQIPVWGDNLRVRFDYTGLGYFWILKNIKICDEYPSPTLPNKSLGEKMYRSNLPYEVDRHGHPYVPDELIIRLAANITTPPASIPLPNGDRLDYLRSCDCDTLHTYRYVSLASTQPYPSPNGGSISIEEKVKQGRASASVRDSDINYYVFSELGDPPACTPNNGQPISSIVQYNIDKDTTSAPIIGFIDSGVDYTNPSMGPFIHAKDTIARTPNQALIGWNVIDRNNNVMDIPGHGTHVANTTQQMLENHYGNNACGIKSRYYKTHDAYGLSTVMDVSCGIKCALRDSVDVINASWGFYTDSVENASMLYDALRAAHDQGVLVVCSAGNDSTLINHPHYHFPSSFNALNQGVFTPLSNIISVGSTNNATSASWFTNISTIYVDVMAMGEDVLAADMCGQTARRSGTSMATAQVTAAAAHYLFCERNGIDTSFAAIRNHIFGHCGFTTASGLSQSGTTILYDCCTDLLRIDGDSVGCDGDTIVLTAYGSSRFLWSTGETTASIRVTQGGTYTVSATAITGCLAFKSKQVSFDSCIHRDLSSVCRPFSSRSPVSGQGWHAITNAQGRKVGSVNPMGQNLGTVTMQVQNHNQIPLGQLLGFCGSNSGQPYLPRYVNLESSVTNSFATPVRVRLFFYNDEFDNFRNLLDGLGCGPVEKEDLEVFHYDGPNENCTFADNIGGQTDVIASNSIVVQPLGSQGFYMEFSVSRFSEFGVGISSGSVPLPIELKYFKGEMRGEAVVLEWATATEKDNDYFVVEKSTDGVSFHKIHQVDGAGTTQIETRYEAQDNAPKPGHNYYRLRQVDFDGRTSTSQVVTVEYEPQFSVQAYPNPMGNLLNVEIYSSMANVEVFIQLLDMNGNQVLSQSAITQKGAIQLPLEVSKLEAGAYILRVVSEQGGFNQLIIKN